MSGYTKLFESLLESTVWAQPDHVRLVWITMLAMADRDGIVEASVPGLAHRARVSIPQCEEALECFRSPDTYSRTKDHDGRRIEEIDGGWKLLNHTKYRERASAEERREKAAERQRKKREQAKKSHGEHGEQDRDIEREERDSHSESAQSDAFESRERPTDGTERDVTNANASRPVTPAGADVTHRPPDSSQCHDIAEAEADPPVAPQGAFVGGGADDHETEWARREQVLRRGWSVLLAKHRGGQVATWGAKAGAALGNVQRAIAEQAQADAVAFDVLAEAVLEAYWAENWPRDAKSPPTVVNLENHLDRILAAVRERASGPARVSWGDVELSVRNRLLMAANGGELTPVQAEIVFMLSGGQSMPAAQVGALVESLLGGAA